MQSRSRAVLAAVVAMPAWSRAALAVTALLFLVVKQQPEPLGKLLQMIACRPLHRV
jgi:hypothetical protein